MKGPGISFAVLVLILGACMASVPPDPSGPAAVTPTAVATSPSPTPIACPGSTWPPYDLAGIAGITATSNDRATIEVTNGTDRAYYYRVAGWQSARFETCQGLLETEVERGPLAAGTTVRVTLGGEVVERMDVPLTIAFWDRPCGESCNRAPVAAMRITRSPVEPAAS